MQIHILNGDALLERFPGSLSGERIVVRECLVDGRVTSAPLEEFCAQRAEELGRLYPDVKTPVYAEEVAPEFSKIAALPSDADVHLWFEDDLFCQVNLWFVCHLLVEAGTVKSAKWVRPGTELRWGFSGVTQQELPDLPQRAVPLRLNELNTLAGLWSAYVYAGTRQLTEAAANLPASLGTIAPAIEAELARRSDNHPRKLLRMMQEMDPAADFGTLFREFTRRAPIYGFGDLQVARLLRE
jgi:hypothetical protein